MADNIVVHMFDNKDNYLAEMFFDNETELDKFCSLNEMLDDPEPTGRILKTDEGYTMWYFDVME